jgi:hypothetical protein
MQQGKQQPNTYADLYTQQRVAAGAPVQQTGSRNAAASDYKGPVVQPVAAAAAAEAGSSSRHSSKGPQLGEAHAAQKPSRIRSHPGQPPKMDHAAPTPGGANKAALGSSAVAKSAGPTLDTLTDVCDTAAAGSAVAGTSSNGSAAVQNGNNTAFQAETSNIQQVRGLS